MDEPAYTVGYGRPPEHTRFQKGRSANPGGKPGPRKRLKRAFDLALGRALCRDAETIRQEKPTKALDLFVKQVVLLALEGGVPAQKLLLSVIERGERDLETEADLVPLEFGSEAMARARLGDRYDDFLKRFNAAIANGSVEEVEALAKEYEAAGKFPQSGNL